MKNNLIVAISGSTKKEDKGESANLLTVADLGGDGGMHPPHQPKHNVHMNTYLKKAISE